MKTIENEILDQILELQIKIARAGELERLSWWQVDATDIAGGGDFFSRLVGPLSGLSSIEAALEGAKALESKKLEDAQVTYEVISLFHPEFQLRMRLQERWMHFKSSPETLPDSIHVLLDHELEFNQSELEEELKEFSKPSHEASAVGKKVRGELNVDPLIQMQQLSSLLLPLEANNYPFPYYPLPV